MPGINYYRLKQTDFDGDFEYSPLVQVNFQPTVYASVEVLGNVVQSQLQVKGTGTLHILNTLGQVEQTAILSGELATIDVSTLAKGNYFIKLEGQPTVQRFIKH